MPTLIDRELYPEESGSGRRPNTFSVLIVLLVTAVVISYLVGYAVPQALIMSDVLQPWPPYDDPRRRWMALSLFTILASWVLLRTRFGNWIFGTGGDTAASTSVGVPTARTTIALFMLVSFFACCPPSGLLTASPVPRGLPVYVATAVTL